MKKLLPLLFFCILQISCGEKVSKDEFDSIKAENEKLKIELEDLKFGPAKLLSQIKNLINSKDYYKAKSEIETLINKHPTSDQTVEAKKLLIDVDANIKALDLANEIEKNKLEKAEKERLANSTKKLRSRKDDIKGITWYYDKTTTVYNDRNSFHLYMGQSEGGKPWLRFRIQYKSDDWLFINSYIIKTDNNSYTISTTRDEVERDNGYGGIWEWYDVPMDNNLYNIVKDVINSKSVKLRYNGKQYYDDRKVSENEKKALQNILDAYEALGGDTNF